MKERSPYQVTTRAKSAPVGVDWLMIRAAKEAARQQKDSRKQGGTDSCVDNREKHHGHTP
jgi:hypothetical protein